MISELLDKLKQTRGEAIFLATNLLAAAHRFNRDNLMPAAVLADQIRECRGEFEAVRAEVTAFFESRGSELRKEAVVTESIDDLIFLLKDYATTSAASAPAVHALLTATLRRALLVRHGALEDFAPLPTFHAVAAALLKEGNAGALNASQQEVAESFGDLLRLVEEGAALPEPEKELLRQSCLACFDRPLVTAAWKGELVIVGAANPSSSRPEFAGV